MLIEINLLPEELRGRARSEKKSRFGLKIPRFVPFVAGGAVILALVVSFAVVTYSGSVKGRLVRAKKILREEEKRAARAITMTTQLADLEKHAYPLIRRVGGKVYWWSILEQVTLNCPPNAVLDSVKFQKGGGVDDPSTLTLAGHYRRGKSLEDRFASNLGSSAKIGKYIDKIYTGPRKIEGDRTIFEIKCEFIMPREDEER